MISCYFAYRIVHLADEHLRRSNEAPHGEAVSLNITNGYVLTSSVSLCFIQEAINVAMVK